MSYYSELQKLIAEGHEPDTSPEVAALRKATIKLHHGGNGKVNVSIVGVTISRVAMHDEDKRELAWYEKRLKQSESFNDLAAQFNSDRNVKSIK